MKITVSGMLLFISLAVGKQIHKVGHTRSTINYTQSYPRDQKQLHKVKDPIYPKGYEFCVPVGSSLPSLCPQGSDHWSKREMRSSLQEFATIWKTRPSGAPTLGGVGVNHAFALWFTIRKLKPTYIIETGVYRGFSTWIMRQAAPSARIYCLDPFICVRRSTEPMWFGPGKKCWDMHFADQNPNTTFMTGKQFKDFAKVDWDQHIPQTERTSTFVMFDDHMSALRRTKEMIKFGFVHLFYEDNLANGGGCYSFNTMCARTPGPTVPYQDYFGTESKQITLAEHKVNIAELNSYVEVYFEFPAIFDGCVDAGRSTSLFTSFQRVAQLGFTNNFPRMKDNDDWWFHYYTPYVRLRTKQPSWTSRLASWLG